MQAGHVFKASGASLYGIDAGKWPARWYDAVALIEQQRIIEHNARVEAEHEKITRG